MVSNEKNKKEKKLLKSSRKNIQRTWKQKNMVQELVDMVFNNTHRIV